MYLAIKEMKKNKSRFALIIAIILLISFLVFFLSALADGLANDKVSAIRLWNSRYIVLDKNANKNIMQSVIPLEDKTVFQEGRPAPLSLMRQSAFINDDRKEDDLLNIVIMGMDKKSAIFPEILKGKSPAAENEVVVSDDMQKENGVKIGDVLHLSKAEQDLKVVGFAKDAKYGNTPVVYGGLKLTDHLFKAPDGKRYVNAFVLTGNRKTSDTKAYETLSMKAFIQKLPGYKAEQMTFLLMIGFLIVIAAIIIGVFIYIMTLQKKNTFGIMKIQGISSAYIGRSVLMETFLTSVTGVLAGMLLTLLAGALLPASVPFKANGVYFAVMALLMMGTSLLGAVFSMRSVSKIDPLKALG